MPSSRLVLLLLLAVLSPGRAAAQTWHRDTTAQRLDWGTVNILIRADTLEGVEVLARTSATLYQDTQRSFDARFRPDSALAWLNQANAILQATSKPDSTTLGLETPALQDGDSNRLVIIRPRDQYGWDNHIRLVFLPPGQGTAWSIRAPLDEAENLLQTLFHQAVRSRFVPDSARPHDANAILTERELKNAAAPALLHKPPLQYPERLRKQRVPGEVWLQFILREDGTPDPASFVALLYNDSAFVNSAVRCLTAAKFRPARLDGRPVRVLIEERVIFHAD